MDEAVLAACDELRRRGTRVFLATNQEHMRARYLMDRLALANHVDGMVYSAQIAAQKHQPAFFHAAAMRNGFSPKNIVLVDDTKANVDAAFEAGWKAIHWSSGSSLMDLLES